MSNKFEDGFGDIFEDFDNEFTTVGFQSNSDRHHQSQPVAAPRISSKKEEHACVDCGGTGIFKSWAGREVGKCFRCKGKGSFKTPAAVRQKAKFQREQRKEQQRQSHLDDFAVRFPELIEELHKMSSWNDFAKSLLGGIEKFGSLTDKQLAAAQRMVDKEVARRAQKAAQRKANTVEVDASGIEETFQTALKSGLKRRCFRALGPTEQTIKLTPGRQGAIWVTVDDEFCGGIVDGKFRPNNQAPEWLGKWIKRIAEVPHKAAKFFGQKTGSCGVCGRELTDPKSIEAGIGPICAEKWGL